MRQQTVVRMLLLVMLLTASFSVVSAQDRVPIRWFVGLGAGTDAPTIALQEAIVAEFNASQEEIELILEVVDIDNSYDVLSTQIAAGNAPDIVGPMGTQGRDSFPGVWLDLAPYIEANNIDLSDYDPALIEFYNFAEEGQIGIPFAVFPYFVMYNQDLFDEAGLPYPPTAYGEPYIDEDGNEREWNTETVAELARILTVDANGNDSTMEEFDANNIIQWGFGISDTDMRGRDTLFGAASMVDESGNAVIPEAWREAENWIHDAMYGEQPFYPSGTYTGSDLLAPNWFGSGNVAMVPIHLWFMGWGTADLDASWNMAPIPAHEGVVTAKLHADTFGIMESTQYPEEAFTVLNYLIIERAEDTAQIYGGMPARLSLQPDFFERYQATLSENYPDTNFDVNWDVAVESLSYPDVPNHEQGIPSFLEARNRYIEYAQVVDNNADADVNAELDLLQADLQAIFDAAGS